MCGIFFTNKIIENIEYVIKYLKNRGPDYTNIEKIYDFTFLHVLLSMTGDNYTIQPFIYKTDEIVILFNGEIYNYKDYGNFNSDGECIIEAYKKYGDDFVKNFEGEFAILLYDNKKNLIIFSTDIFGIKPLWFSINNNNICVSSYKSCLERMGFSNCAEVESNKTYFIDSTNYTIIKTQTVYDFDLNQYKISYNDWNIAFENSIRKRTRGIKHKVYIGLSSGYDSGAIACALVKLGIDFKSYTIKGSENTETILKRRDIHDNVEFINISEQKFMEQKQYLINNCENYNLFIDNDEEKNLNYWTAKKKELINNNSSINEIQNADNKINAYQKAFNNAINKNIYEDNGAIGLGIICEIARPKNELIYLTGSGADEIFSDYGWKGVRHYRHSTIGGYFPEDLKNVFPWRNFFGNTQRAYLRKEEYVAGTYGIEGRYPFLDKYVVQEFLWLHPDLKNCQYKAPIYNYLTINNYPFDLNKKVGFNCGMSSGQNNEIKKKIADRTTIGETNDDSLLVNIK